VEIAEQISLQLLSYRENLGRAEEGVCYVSMIVGEWKEALLESCWLVEGGMIRLC
jgi:hypothetical protein